MDRTMGAAVEMGETVEVVERWVRSGGWGGDGWENRKLAECQFASTGLALKYHFT